MSSGFGISLSTSKKAESFSLRAANPAGKALHEIAISGNTGLRKAWVCVREKLCMETKKTEV